LHFHVNTEHLYIVDIYIYANNSKKRECIVAVPWQQWLRRGATVPPSRYIVDFVVFKGVLLYCAGNLRSIIYILYTFF